MEEAIEIYLRVSLLTLASFLRFPFLHATKQVTTTKIATAATLTRLNSRSESFGRFKRAKKLILS